MKKASVNSAANCVKGCARRFGYFLYNPSSRTVHKLSDQELQRDFPNQRVRVKGRLDKATNTIMVSSIEPAGKSVGREGNREIGTSGHRVVGASEFPRQPKLPKNRK